MHIGTWSIALAMVCLISCTGEGPVDFARAEYLGTWQEARVGVRGEKADRRSCSFLFSVDSFYIRSTEPGAANSISADEKPGPATLPDSGIWQLNDETIRFFGANDRTTFSASFGATLDTLVLRDDDGMQLVLSRR